jgi:hypothetical protein
LLWYMREKAALTSSTSLSGLPASRHDHDDLPSHDCMAMPLAMSHSRQMPDSMPELAMPQISLLGFLLLASIVIQVGVRYK